MATSTIITYGGSSIQGANLAAATRYTILAQQAIARALAAANAMTGGGVTPANMEGDTPQFGAVPAGGGTALYNAINNLATNLAAITAASLAETDQG